MDYYQDFRLKSEYEPLQVMPSKFHLPEIAIQPLEQPHHTLPNPVHQDEPYYITRPITPTQFGYFQTSNQDTTTCLRTAPAIYGIAPLDIHETHNNIQLTTHDQVFAQSPHQQYYPRYEQMEPIVSNNTQSMCGMCYMSNCDLITDPCGHQFHSTCLNDWNTPCCPSCRCSINSFNNLIQVSNTYTEHPKTSTSSSSSSTMIYSNSNSNTSIQPTSYDQPVVSNHQVYRGIDDVAAKWVIEDNNSTTSYQPLDQLAEATSVVAESLLYTGPYDTKQHPTSTQYDGDNSSKRKAPTTRHCSIPGCTRGIRSRGLCKGHGGGRRCKVESCGLSDQGGGFCISHGGGKRCVMVGCDNSSQSKGLCKAHGGGSRCTVAGCTKSSQSVGLCRAHGGGRRCTIPGCNKTDRRAGYCVTHGADRKCKINSCTKTGRIDGFCTKHSPMLDVRSMSTPTNASSVHTLESASFHGIREQEYNDNANQGVISSTYRYDSKIDLMSY